MKACIDALILSSDSKIAVFREALNAYNRSGSLIWNSVFLAKLVETLLMAGRIEDAKEVLQEGFRFVDTSGERYWLSELHRMEGMIALADPEPDFERVEGCFLRGFDVAAQQEASLLQLRLAAEMTRSGRNMGSQVDPVALIKSVLSKIDGGEHYPDVQRARAVLAEMEHDPGSKLLQ